jgi:hypothetical protein
MAESVEPGQDQEKKMMKSLIYSPSRIQQNIKFGKRDSQILGNTTKEKTWIGTFKALVHFISCFISYCLSLFLCL